jgi:O-antigen ligase
MKDFQQLLNQQVIPWLAIATCFSLSLGIQPQNIAIGLFFIAWVISGNWSEKYHRIITNPIAIMAIGLFILYGIGMFHSEVSWNTKSMWWFRYHKLLYIPFFISAIKQDHHRAYAINAFLICSLLILAGSYLMWLGIIPTKDTGQGYIVFTNRIAQSIFMAFAMFIMLIKAKHHTGQFKVVWLVLAALAALNIFILVNGRTGQVIALCLIVFLAYENWGKKLLLCLMFCILLITASHQYLPQSRLTDISKEITTHKKNTLDTSTGQRMEFYENTLSIILHHPILGGGTGSFEQEFSAQAKSKNIEITHLVNPHNQFLLITQELGVIGLMFFLAFWFMQWNSALHISKSDWRIVFRGLIITIFVGSLFNSLLLDAAEGKFYCVMAGVLLSAYLPKKRTD